MVVIVTGDFDSQAAAAKIREAFAGVAPGQAFEWTKTARPSAPSNVLLIDKPDATQTYFYIAQPGIDRKSPDRVKLLLINTLFGGRFTSMLNEELRVKSGLSYGASCMLQRLRLSGRHRDNDLHQNGHHGKGHRHGSGCSEATWGEGNHG